MRGYGTYLSWIGLMLGLVAAVGGVNAAEGPLSTTKEIEVAPGPPPTFALALKADRESGRYRVGEKVAFSVETTRDCYLTLLNIGTSGQVKLLLPNQFQRGNLLRAGASQRVPTTEAPFEFTLNGPPGTEGVMAICALDAIPVGLQPAATWVLPSQVSVAVQVQTKDIEATLKPIPKDRWAIATITLEVEPSGPSQ